MNIVILGCPGSGKGTQAQLLAQKLGLFHLETGEILRQESKKKTATGRKIARLLKEGRMVPDKVTMRLIRPFLIPYNFKKGIIFDGFPRRISQVYWLEKELVKKGEQIDRFIYLWISSRESRKRLGSRRVCPKCGQNFNLLTLPPKKDEICDNCQVKLIKRNDDMSRAISKRLTIFRHSVLPVVKYFKNKGNMVRINGEQQVEKVFKDILRALNDLNQNKKRN